MTRHEGEYTDVFNRRVKPPKGVVLSQAIIRWVVLFTTVGALGSAGCKKTAPSPWKEMGFPLRHADIRPGTDPDRLLVVYRNISRLYDLFREFRQTIEREGYTYEREGKEHDPSVRTLSMVFKKGGERLLLTVTASKDTNISVRKIKL